MLGLLPASPSGGWDGYPGEASAPGARPRDARRCGISGPSVLPSLGVFSVWAAGAAALRAPLEAAGAQRLQGRGLGRVGWGVGARRARVPRCALISAHSA